MIYLTLSRFKPFNDSTEKKKFRKNLILADITPIYKNSDPLDKTTYQSFSVVHVVSTIFKRIMQKRVISLLAFFLPIYVVIERVLIPNTPF